MGIPLYWMPNASGILITSGKLTLVILLMRSDSVHTRNKLPDEFWWLRCAARNHSDSNYYTSLLSRNHSNHQIRLY